MQVTVSSNESGRLMTVGRLLWNGVQIVVDPETEEDRATLMFVLSTPIVIEEQGEPVRVTRATPEQFVRNLHRHYKGSYFRVSKPE